MFILSLAFGAAAKSSWEPLQIGQFSGRPGYYVKLGTSAQVDAIVVSEEVANVLRKALAKTDPGLTKTCQVKGLHQAIGYTIFKIKGCK